jgi:hypothetical protein
LKLKTGPEDGIYVQKHVVLDSKLHLLEIELYGQEYSKYYVQVLLYGILSSHIGGFISQKAEPFSLCCTSE